MEKVQQDIDILPPDVGYFNVSWAHRDIGYDNIFTVEFMNGAGVIPAYNDGANAGRISLGFPTVQPSGGSVFDSDLGFTTLKEGALLPCFFETAAGFAGPFSGKSLECKLRKSYTNNYNVWI